MSSSTQHNASPAPDAPRPGSDDERRNPLGFADVRASQPDVPATVEAHGVPVGFAPTDDATVPQAPEAVFRTEISFRRDHRSLAAVRADASSGTGHGAEPQVGHAEVRPLDDQPEEETMRDEPMADADEKVPFYKREISLGRRKEPVSSEPPVEVEAMEPQATEDAPFFKREISFGRRKEPVGLEPMPDEAPDAVAFGPDEPMPFYKRELSFKRRRGAADAAEASAAEDAGGVMAPAEADTPTAPGPAAATPFQEAASPRDEESATLDVVESTPIVHEEIESAAVADAFFADDEPPAAPVETQSELGFEAEPLPIATAAAAASAQDVPNEQPAAPSAPTSSARRSIRVGRGLAAGSRGPKRGGGKRRQTVGLKIGASQVAAAVVVDNGGRQELVQLARRPIEAGIVVDGEVKDVAALTEHVRALFDENAFPRTNVRIGLASNRIGVRTLDIDGIDDAARFDNAVRFKAHEVLPVAFHESVLDYRVVEERPTETGETVKRVLLVVAPRDQVEPYLQMCAGAGLRLAGIDLEALGLLRAFVEPHPLGFRVGDDTATVVVSLGHEATTLLVAGGGICDFTRVFDWGGEALQGALATELDVSGDEAATILRHLSLTGRGRELESLSDEQRIRAGEAIRARLTPFARELVSSLQFYQTQPDSLGIGEIVITGGTSHLAGLAEALQQMIGVSVRFGDPLARVVVQGVISDEVDANLGSLAVAIGLGIEDAPWRSVNLLPPELRQQGRKRPGVLTIAAPAVAVVAVAALAVGFVQARGDASDRRAEFDAVQAQIAALPEPSRPTIDPALQGDQVARAEAVAAVLGSRVAWEPLFRDLSRALPANVWLEHVGAEAADVSGPIPAATTAQNSTPTSPTGVTIEGFTFKQRDVALLLARLQAIPSLRNVTLKSARREQKGVKKVDVVSFSILADLNGGGQ